MQRDNILAYLQMYGHYGENNFFKFFFFMFFSFFMVLWFYGSLWIDLYKRMNLVELNSGLDGK